MTAIQGPMEGVCCIEGLLRTFEQLCDAVHVRMAELPQGQEHQAGCQVSAGTVGQERLRLGPSLLIRVFLHFNFFAAAVYIPRLRAAQVPPLPISLA